MASSIDDRMVSEKIAPVLVARTLGPFDLVVIFIAIVLFINNSAGVQAAGPSVFIFWILAFATFLITGGFVTAQLGRMFPEEGSLYVWTHKALGPFWGFFAGFVAWWPGPIVMVTGGILVATFIQTMAGFISDNPILTKNWQVGLVVLAVLWFSALMSVLKMRLTQNYVNIQFFAYAAAIFLIGLAGVVWLLKGNASSTDFGTGWNPFQGAKPVLGIPANLAIFSFAILALLGIESPLNMGVEVNGGEKAIRTYLFWGCIIVMAAYLWTTWGNMVVIQAGAENANGTTGGALAVGAAMGDGFGIIVAAILAWVFLTATVVYNYAFARLLFVSGLEKRLPHQLGKVNKNKVPANAVLLQTIIASIIAVVVFFVFGAGDGDANKPFYILYAGLTIVWCISTALLFLDIFFAKRAAPAKFEESRRIPVRWLYICGAVGTVVNILAVFFIFVGSWYPTGFPKLSVWNAWMFAITAISVVTGIAIYLISEATGRRGKTEQELTAEVAGEVGAG